MKRKIAVVSSSRADYGLLRWVMQGLKDDPKIELQIIVTGMHLSPLYGDTYKAIEDDGFRIDEKVEILSASNSMIGASDAMALAISGVTNSLNRLKPDLVVLLGDRYEIFACAAAALVCRIPVAHINGGEVTAGAFDEAFRHSITKMSHLHFVATSEYESRVVQLGEDPKRVFLVGGTGIDNVKRLNLLSREDLEFSLGLEFGMKSLLITFHPATLSSETPERQMEELLAALSALTETRLIFTMPNADPGSQKIAELIHDFVKKHRNANAFNSLGQLKYLSCLAQVDGVIGNSSSGLMEVPSFRKGTINIGRRQSGRIQASSVINCEPKEVEIRKSIDRLYSAEFQSLLRSTINPYGEGGASNEIVKILAHFPLEGIIEKTFYDL
jgi:GDP/UDP-N,N'-diacetylbacillosamine 2-epimerase (hydrolysing)